MGNLKARNISLDNEQEDGSNIHIISNWSVDLPDTGLFFISGSDYEIARRLFNRISGTEENGEGDITICGSSIYGSDGALVRSNLCGYVMNNLDLFNKYDVRSSLLLATDNSDEAQIMADRLINELQLNWCSSSKVSKLAVKDKIVVAMARALMNDPRVLFIDDSAVNCESYIKENIYNLYRKVAQDRLVVVCTKDCESAILYGNGVIKCENGNIVKCNIYDGILEELPESVNTDHNKVHKTFTLNWRKLNIKHRGYIRELAIISLLFAFIITLSTLINIDEVGFYEDNAINYTHDTDVQLLDADSDASLYTVPYTTNRGKDFFDAVKKYIGKESLILEVDSTIYNEESSADVILRVAYEETAGLNILEGNYPVNYDELLIPIRVLEEFNTDIGSTVYIGKDKFKVVGISDEESIYVYLSYSYLNHLLESTTPISLLGGNFNLTECDRWDYYGSSFLYAPYEEVELIIGNEPQSSNDIVVSLQCAYRLGYTEKDLDQLIGKEYEYKSNMPNSYKTAYVDLYEIFDGPVRISGIVSDTDNATVYTSENIFKKISSIYYNSNCFTGIVRTTDNIFEQLEESGNLVCNSIFNDMGMALNFTYTSTT